MYSDNPVIEDIVLKVIGDANGSQCGMTYVQRCAAAEFGLQTFRNAVAVYAGQRVRDGGSKPTVKERLETASIIQDYYREHVKESV